MFFSHIGFQAIYLLSKITLVLEALENEAILALVAADIAQIVTGKKTHSENVKTLSECKVLGICLFVQKITGHLFSFPASGSYSPTP